MRVIARGCVPVVVGARIAHITRTRMKITRVEPILDSGIRRGSDASSE